MSGLPAWPFAVLLVAATVALGAGCASEQRVRDADEAVSPGATSAAAWIRGTREASGAADRAIDRGATAEARRVLSEAVARETPRDVSAEDARIVKQDLLYRLAELELSAGDAAAAADRADEGLNLGRGRDVFTANLLVVRGRAREALGREREAAGDYFDALEINEALLGEALGGEDDDEAPDDDEDE